MYSYASFAAFIAGFPDKAWLYSDKSLALSEELAHPFSRVYPLHYAAHLRYFMGDSTEVLSLATAQIELATEHEFAAFTGGGQLYLGLAQAMLETGTVGLDSALAGLDCWRNSKALTAVPMYLAWCADALSRRSQDQLALPMMSEALALTVSIGDGIHEAEIYRLFGEQTARIDADAAREEAASHFTRALAIARKQQALMWELRAATSLARLRQKQGRCNEASELLEPVFERFTEGFDTSHLREAKALLESLA